MTDLIAALEQRERDLVLDRFGVVASATASGLSSMEDHELVVAGLREFLEEP